MVVAGEEVVEEAMVGEGEQGDGSIHDHKPEHNVMDTHHHTG